MKKRSDSRVKTSLFPLQGFLLSFMALALMTTGQMFILRQFLDIGSLSRAHVCAVVLYWLVVAAVFILFTRRQIIQHYQEPMEEFADATRKVAEGDFSVYVPPRHTPDQRDYIDVIFADFNTMVEELGSMEILKTDFIANVSHEIRTPLAVIHGYATELRKGNVAKAQQEAYLDSIIEASTRLSDLVGNMLKLNKLEKQVIRPSAEPFDVCAQLCACALLFENAWSAKGITCEVDLEDCAYVERDASLLEMVWNNLLANAIKFTQPGGTIVLKQTSSEQEIVVSVSDTGCGMSEDTLKHIFDKFFQGDTSHSTEGNGLGLALVWRILQLMESSITVSSALGVGSVFTVRIPVNETGIPR